MRLYALLVICCFSTGALAKEIVKVGIYDFPPYAFVANKITGISVQMLAEMNKFQDKYQFVAVPTTARRRYRDFDNHKYDMLIFESKNWGWQQYPVNVSKPFVTGFEVYVTQNQPGRGQEYFSDLTSKAIIGVLGYHYQFANFSTDQQHLASHFNLIQTSSQEKSLKLLLKGRGDIAVLTKEYLNYHFLISPEDRAKLLISDKFDQIYQHTILVRQHHKLSVKYINELLEQMNQQGVLMPLWQQYGLELK
ncbi:amino acid ABC transporter substrate-binding protein [Thalassotalea insulae]|uniref:Amino acid ABC transporter substrate-binding protein n=1 Tax=Thalassotalea insulae TaxID=2056778 RepID=A0ABQ6GN56_9GAMM|nr:transporter substrate-binding domain-containing protein [Thalassotalea insulae]GLX76994.1 amino acid ABC transporter substrate-binding protein [Thalassotalea insulae]